MTDLEMSRWSKWWEMAFRPRKKSLPKVSALGEFIGKELALEAQKRGLQIAGDLRFGNRATEYMILGLCQILEEYGLNGKLAPKRMK